MLYQRISSHDVSDVSDHELKKSHPTAWVNAELKRREKHAAHIRSLHHHFSNMFFYIIVCWIVLYVLGSITYISHWFPTRRL